MDAGFTGDGDSALECLFPLEITTAAGNGPCRVRPSEWLGRLGVGSGWGSFLVTLSGWHSCRQFLRHSSVRWLMSRKIEGGNPSD